MAFIIIRPKSVSPSVYSLSTPTPRLFHFIFSPPPPSSHAIDPAPLLLSGDENEGSNSNGGGEQRRSSSVRRPGLREAARLLSRASSGGGRAMREPSMVMREVAAEQLEERQSDWAYLKPIVVLDIVWNLAFVSVAGAILVMARNEHPIMPLRVWLLGDHIVQTIKAAWLDKRLWDEAMEYDPLDVHVAHTTSQSHTSHDLLPEAELYRMADASCKSPTDKVGIEWSLTNKEGILKLQGNAAVEATNSDSDTKMLCS
ncbi:hypothetical protein Bca52824_048398 [Brassica carinata]|uniref:RING-type E3 ubiquitin transferase n=1 Tax=Brassica carinata TaxID=52824 RepID=A0A8X7US58_BRACI|nr:hypothetical protein Bca52824_048398 [Brassica carinata]